jgi:hypothetical protein
VGGVLAGAMPSQLAQLADAARQVHAQLDATDVDRIDFIFAGALFNAIQPHRDAGEGRADHRCDAHRARSCC